MTSLLNHPIFFNRNRVFRVYTGGKLFHSFFGDEAVDGNLPEEWVASRVRALNKVSAGPAEGLSFVEGTDTTFASLLEEYPVEMTGGRSFDVLVKLLDSAVRLPAQTHPDKALSRQFFNSEHGKTECWLILATRPGAVIYFGFKDGISRAELERAVELSENQGDAFSELMQRVPARAGDVWLIPARVAHAIGAGCLILEVQEPTDFTIQPERWCDQYRLSDQEMYLGLEPRIALDCFDLSQTGDGVLQRGRKTPVPVERFANGVKEALITYDDTPCFAVYRLRLQGAGTAICGPAVFVVTEGSGKVMTAAGWRQIKRGDYFFVPAAAGEVAVATETGLEIVECLPPRR
jgi:mannose-6-phosphate isomerase